jgi:hypothetical protein
MPITLPNLDDRRYADLVEEGRALIPTYAPEWTDHNEVDPGITLIELFAYLSEMLLYRLNRVTDENRYAFLKLLNPDLKLDEETSLEEQVHATVLALREANRAVTCADFEKLTLEVSRRQERLVADFAGRVARAHCVPRRNLEMQDEAGRNEDLPNHTSVIVVPEINDSNNTMPQPTDRLKQTIAEYLEERRLVTNVIHVVGPRYLAVRVQLTAVLTPDTLAAQEADVRKPIEDAVRAFLHPVTGGPEGKGWPFGRNVYVSEIYEILDRQRTVDYVRPTEVEVPGSENQELDELAPLVETSRRRLNAAKELVAVELREDELVSVELDIKLEFPKSQAQHPPTEK